MAASQLAPARLEERTDGLPGGAALGRCFLFLATVGAVGLGAVGLEDNARLVRLLEPLQEGTAEWAGWLAQAFGMSVTSEGTGLRHVAGFGFAVNYRCTGLVESLVVAVGLLGLPGPVRPKWIWVVLGTILMVGLNLFRLVSLLYLGVRDPAAFDLAHDVVWSVIMLVAILGIWCLWMVRQNIEYRGHGKET